MATKGHRLLGLALALCGVLAAAGCGDDDAVRLRTGVTTGVDAPGVALSLDEGDGEGEGYVVGNGVEWIGTDGVTRESGQPECLPPMSSGAEVVLHIVEYDGRARVVRVECHTLPTELHGAGEEGPSPFLPYCEARARSPQPVPEMVEDPCPDP